MISVKSSCALLLGYVSAGNAVSRALALALSTLFLAGCVFVPLPTSDFPPTVFELDPEPLDAPRPRVLWRFQAGKVASTPTVVDGIVYFGSEDFKIYAVDASSGKLIWRYQSVDWVTASPAVVDGVLYIGGHDSNVYALGAANGELIWLYETGSWAYDPVVVDGVVYICSVDGHLYALSAASGELYWRSEAGWVDSAPVVVDGVVYVGSVDEHVYAFDAAGGELLWRYARGEGFPPSDSAERQDPAAQQFVPPSVTQAFTLRAAADGFAFAGSNAANLYTWYSVDEELFWRHAGGERLSPLASADGLVPAAEQFTTPSPTQAFTVPAVADGVVYAGSADGHLYALDAASGRPLWVFPRVLCVRVQPWLRE